MFCDTSITTFFKLNYEISTVPILTFGLKFAVNKFKVLGRDKILQIVKIIYSKHIYITALLLL